MLLPPFSSAFSVVFLNFFHHDASSLLDGGDTGAKGDGAGAGRWRGWTMGRGEVAVPAPPVAMVWLQAQCALQRSRREVSGMAYSQVLTCFWILGA